MESPASRRPAAPRTPLTTLAAVALAAAALLALTLSPGDARAEEPAVPPATESAPAAWARFGDHPHAPAFEVNVLWPLFPGGLVDLKVMVPVLRPSRRDFRGELVLGVHSDFGWRNLRAADAGKVAFLGAKLGYRQFLVYGLHLDVTLNTGWRQEVDNPWDHTTLDAFTGRLWLLAGWQVELNRAVYLNFRGGGGIHLFRTDRFADRERAFAPGGDLNLGFRFW